MGGYSSGYSFAFRKELLPVVGGVTGGALQLAVTGILDTQGSLGTPFVPVLGTNGDLINFVTGGVSLTAAVLTWMGHGGRYLSSHNDVTLALGAYGATTFIGGWLVPRIVSAVTGTGSRALGREAQPGVGAGRVSATPTPRGGSGPNQRFVRAFRS